MSDRPTPEERLNDPLSHFPYKHTEALQAVGSNPLAQDEVDATAAYIEAQAAYLADPSDETRAVERAAADDLQATRAARREARETTRDGSDDGMSDDDRAAVAALLNHGEV